MITTTNNKKEYAANGITDEFAFPYLFLIDDHLKVFVDNVEITVGITKLGAGNPSGGSVQFVTPPADESVVTLLRQVPYTQLTDFINGNTLREEHMEDPLDKLTMLVQQLKNEIDSGIRIEGQETSLNPLNKSDRIGTLIYFDDGGELESISIQELLDLIVNTTATPPDEIENILPVITVSATAGGSTTVISNSLNGKLVKADTSAGALTLEAPTTGLSIGFAMSVVNYGSNPVYFTGASGVLVRASDGLLDIDKQYGVATFNKIIDAEYLVAGNLV